MNITICSIVDRKIDKIELLSKSSDFLLLLLTNTLYDLLGVREEMVRTEFLEKR